MSGGYGRICHVVVAGGSGTRFGGSLPKQFLPLDGVPVIVRAIRALLAATPDASVVVAMNPAYSSLWSDMCGNYDVRLSATVNGGASRAESVRNALVAVPDDVDIISVHDAARPIVDPAMVKRLVEAVGDGAVGAVPVVAVSDSLRIVDGSDSKIVDRDWYRRVQTPQMFRADFLRKAYSLPMYSAFTDDASVVEAAGYGAPRLVEGSETNIKITHPADLIIASALLSSGRWTD